MGYFYDFKPYVPVAERRRRATDELKKLAKKGHVVSPVVIEGREIARTFWGRAWCDNLERYRDYDSRLPRGRSYVRNGSVVDLQLGPGKVEARVSGSRLYEVVVTVAPLAKARWASIRADCAGGVDSLVELLQGRFSQAVMERLCRQDTGLFPAPKEIQFSCSCPDWASMCKHVAAVLYGVGSRLDERPELLFALREVDEKDLIASAAAAPMSAKTPAEGKRLAEGDLSALFGLDLAEAGAGAAADSARPRRGRRRKAVPDGSASAAPDETTNEARLLDEIAGALSDGTRRAKDLDWAAVTAEELGVMRGVLAEMLGRDEVLASLRAVRGVLNREAREGRLGKARLRARLKAVSDPAPRRPRGRAGGR